MPYRNGQLVNWKVKVRGLRPLLTEDNSDKNAIKVGKKFYKILTSSLYKRYFKEFDDLDEFQDVEGLEHFNDVLNRLYDYCDENLIWIDFK